MSQTPNPSILDKNKKKDGGKANTSVTPELAKPNTEPERELSVNEKLARDASGETDNSGQGSIVHVVRTLGPDGVLHEKKHGPMPISEWANYSAKNGL